MNRQFDRREVLTLGVVSAATTAGVAARANDIPTRNARGLRPSEFGPLGQSLNQFVAAYMAALRIPGAIIGLVDPDGRAHSATYGYSDMEVRRAVSPMDRFQIGSITKSFTAIVILQLQDEGKLDVHDSVRRHLPWLLMETPFGEVTIHHLLTHSSGLPSNCPLFPFDSGTPGPRQTFKPGSQFHYSNWGYRVLGRLAEHLDGRPLSAVFKARILEPLDMSATLPVITNEGRPLIAPSYVPMYEDRPYPQRGALIRAGSYEFTFAAGCIASTAADMTSYIRMLLNGGRGPRSRVLSEAAFRAFSTPHIPAPEFELPEGPEFAPHPSYGYGIVVEQFEGRRRIRHSGGMPSFRSTLHVDLDAGVGAFVSMNANQGYGPNPIANYANQVLRARKLGSAAPPPPEADDEDWQVKHPAQYCGSYLTSNGRKLEVLAVGKRLLLIGGSHRIPLQHVGGDTFVSADQSAAEQAGLDLFPFVFSRQADRSNTETVVGLGYGSDWYASASLPIATRPEPESSENFDAYVGLYSPSRVAAQQSTRVVSRRGRLWINGVTPLTSLGDHKFRVGEESFSPETLDFRYFVDGRAQILMLPEGPQDRIGDPYTR